MLEFNLNPAKELHRLMFRRAQKSRFSFAPKGSATSQTTGQRFPMQREVPGSNQGRGAQPRNISVLTADQSAAAPMPQPRPVYPTWPGLVMGDQFGLQVLKGMKTPMFTGHSADWPAFVRAWDVYEGLVRQVSGGAVNDMVLLQALNECLDEGSSIQLQFQLEQDQKLSFRTFWSYLCNLHGYDIRFQNRKAWQNVRLQQTGSKLTKKDFIVFHGQFLQARARVMDRSEPEEYKLLTEQLPHYWREQLHREELRRRRNRYDILLEMSGATTQEVELICEDLFGVSHLKVTRRGDYFEIECPNEDTQQSAVEMLDGSVVEGVTIHVDVCAPRMKGEEILSWLMERLTSEEEFKSQYEGVNSSGYQSPRPQYPQHQLPRKSSVSAMEEDRRPPSPARESWRDGRGNKKPALPAPAANTSQPKAQSSSSGKGKGYGKGSSTNQPAVRRSSADSRGSGYQGQRFDLRSVSTVRPSRNPGITHGNTVQ